MSRIGMYQYLTESINFIHKNILKDKAVLVYCDSANQKASNRYCCIYYKMVRLMQILQLK